MDKDKIQQLQSLKVRLEQDMRRISMLGGIPGPNDAITKNYRNVVTEIQKLKQ